MFDDPFAIDGLLRPMELGDRRKVWPSQGNRPRPAARGQNFRPSGGSRPGKVERDFWACEHVPERPMKSKAARALRAENLKRAQAALLRTTRASRVS